jgi:hypothetical protein
VRVATRGSAATRWRLTRWRVAGRRTSCPRSSLFPFLYSGAVRRQPPCAPAKVRAKRGPGAQACTPAPRAGTRSAGCRGNRLVRCSSEPCAAAAAARKRAAQRKAEGAKATESKHARARARRVQSALDRGRGRVPHRAVTAAGASLLPRGTRRRRTRPAPATLRRLRPNGGSSGECVRE